MANKPELDDWLEGISLLDFGLLKGIDWDSPELKQFENVTYAVSYDQSDKT